MRPEHIGHFHGDAEQDEIKYVVEGAELDKLSRFPRVENGQ